MKKPTSSASGGGLPSPLKACPFQAKFPTVWSFLSDQLWDDGSARLPGTLLLITNDGWFKCWVNDKDGNRTAWVSADTLAGLLEAVNEGLEGDCLEWRRSLPPAGGRRGK